MKTITTTKTILNYSLLSFTLLQMTAMDSVQAATRRQPASTINSKKIIHAQKNRMPSSKKQQQAKLKQLQQARLAKPIRCDSEALLNDIQNYRLGLNQSAEHHKTEGMGTCLYRKYKEVKASKEAEAKKSIFKRAPKTVMEYVNLIQKEVDKYADKRVSRVEVCDIDEGAEIYDSHIEKCRDTGMEIKRIGAITDEDLN